MEVSSQEWDSEDVTRFEAHFFTRSGPFRLLLLPPRLPASTEPVEGLLSRAREHGVAAEACQAIRSSACWSESKHETLFPEGAGIASTESNEQKPACDTL